MKTLAVLGILALIVVVVIGVLTSMEIITSEAEVESIEDVNTALNLDNPKICKKMDEPTSCVNNFAYIYTNPQTCIDFLDDEQLRYECLLGLIPKMQSEKICNYVSSKFYDDCMLEVVYWKNN